MLVYTTDDATNTNTTTTAAIINNKYSRAGLTIDSSQPTFVPSSSHVTQKL